MNAETKEVTIAVYRQGQLIWSKKFDQTDNSENGHYDLGPDYPDVSYSDVIVFKAVSEKPITWIRVAVGCLREIVGWEG